SLDAEMERLLKQEKLVHREYDEFMRTLIGRQADAAAVGECCGSVRHDPIASLFCALVRYRSEERQSYPAFIGALPRTKTELADFWALDSIAAAATGEMPEWP